VTFFEKFSILAQRRGLSPRGVALTVGLDPSAVAQWKRRGGRPNPATAAQLAAFFRIGVETLMDDTRSLPGEEPPGDDAMTLSEPQSAYGLALGPIKTAKALAQREHGSDPAAGQTTFERHLANLRSMRDQAERLHPGNPAAAAAQLDILVASYIAALDRE
jgi:transcriptional regulator with XRE-family HTH domain